MLSSSYNSGKNSAIWFWTFLVEWHNPISLLLDHDLQFHGQSFSILLDLRISRKWWEIEQKLLLPSDGKSSIFMEWRYCGCCTLWSWHIFSRSRILKCEYLKNGDSWQKCSGITSIQVDICHRMVPLRVLYSMSLTFIFKLILFALAIKKLSKHQWPKADLPRLTWPAPWSCSCI